MTIHFVGQAVQDALLAASSLAHTADEAACHPQWACDRTLADCIMQAARLAQARLLNAWLYGPCHDWDASEPFTGKLTFSGRFVISRRASQHWY